MNELVCFDNSLKEITSNLSTLLRRTQQNSPLYTASFISNFHCRYKLNKAEHNKTFSIAPKTPPIVRVLSRLKKGIKVAHPYAKVGV